MAIIGIAKRLEELYFPGDSIPLHLDKRSESLKLIQRMRDEAHRFSLSHHRKRRSAAALRSELDDIPGIGPATRHKLLAEFGTVDRIKSAKKKPCSRSPHSKWYRPCVPIGKRRKGEPEQASVRI